MENIPVKPAPVLDGDLLFGAEAIAEWLGHGVDRRQVYYLAANNRLDGIWREGRKLCGLKSIMAESLVAKARRGSENV